MGKHTRGGREATGAGGGDGSRTPRHRHGRTVAVVLCALVAAAGIAFAIPASRRALTSALLSTDTGDDEATSVSGAATVADASASDAGASDQAASDSSASDASASAVGEASAEDETPLDTSASATVTTTTTSDGITVTAPDGFTSTPTFQHLQEAVAAFASKGYSLGFSLVDLDTGRAVSYNVDQTFYPASSIKAVYCTIVLETYGSSAVSASGSTIQSCLVNSDNDAFRSLLKTYGYTVYGDWLQSYAPEAASEAYGYNYPHISASGMLNCWREIYRFGTSGEAGADLLASCLSQTTTSAWGTLLRDRYTVWAKAGWYPANEGLASTATADNAIVFSDCGDYAVAVLSDAPSDFDSLLPVLDALNAAHGKMCGGSSALLQTSDMSVM